MIILILIIHSRDIASRHWYIDILFLFLNLIQWSIIKKLMWVFFKLRFPRACKKETKIRYYLCAFFHCFFFISNVDKVHVSEVLLLLKHILQYIFSIDKCLFFFGFSTNSQAPLDTYWERCPEEAFQKEHYPREDSLSVGVS